MPQRFDTYDRVAIVTGSDSGIVNTSYDWRHVLRVDLDGPRGSP